MSHASMWKKWAFYEHGDEAREQKIIAKTTERNTAVGSRNNDTFHFPTLATLPV